MYAAQNPAYRSARLFSITYGAVLAKLCHNCDSHLALSSLLTQIASLPNAGHLNQSCEGSGNLAMRRSGRLRRYHRVYPLCTGNPSLDPTCSRSLEQSRYSENDPRRRFASLTNPVLAHRVCVCFVRVFRIRSSRGLRFDTVGTVSPIEWAGARLRLARKARGPVRECRPVELAWLRGQRRAGRGGASE
jgi:hypothetical protein